MRKLRHLLIRKKKNILQTWVQSILQTYPSSTSMLLEQENDQFNNPVGYHISREMAHIYDELSHGMDDDKLYTSIKTVTRIRSVQDFSPSQAVIFVYLLKTAVRHELEEEVRQQDLLDDMLEFEAEIDKLALLAFDAYMSCREKLFEIRVREIKDEKDRAFKLLERLNGSCR